MSQPLSPRAAPSHARVTRVTVSQVPGSAASQPRVPKLHPADSAAFGFRPTHAPGFGPQAVTPETSIRFPPVSAATTLPTTTSAPAASVPSARPASVPKAPLTHTPLTRSSRQLLGLYLSALLALAWLGAQNQRGYERHETLLGQKEALQTQLQGLRHEAAGVTGALEVRRWALARGMIAAPEALNIYTTAPTAAPVTPLPEGELELYTLWR